MLQPRIAASCSRAAASEAATSVSQAKSGQPLRHDARRVMEGHFGQDFSSVRVHADADADALTLQRGASAFTSGEEISFAAGRYDPYTRGGAALLAHELTHVVQQRRSGGEPSTEHEAEAREAARAVDRGTTPVVAFGSARGWIQHAPPVRDPLSAHIDDASPPTEGHSPEPHESRTIGAAGERHQFGEAEPALRSEGYTEVYFKGRFPGWLRRVFPSKTWSPEVVAIDRSGRRLLVEDFTAGPWSTAALKAGDPRRLPQDVPRSPRAKPPRQDIHHLEKTVGYGRQAERNLPPELEGFSVAARDRYWKHGGGSREVTIRARAAATRPPAGPGGAGPGHGPGSPKGKPAEPHPGGTRSAKARGKASHPGAKGVRPKPQPKPKPGEPHRGGGKGVKPEPKPAKPHRAGSRPKVESKPPGPPRSTGEHPVEPPTPVKPPTAEAKSVAPSAEAEPRIAAGEGGGFKGVGPEVAGAVVPLVLGWIHQRAVPKRLAAIANEKGFASAGSVSGPWYDRFLDRAGEVLYDPTLEGERSVSVRTRLNVPVWRTKVRDYFAGHKVGDQVTFTWEGPEGDTELTYTLAPDGRWIESKHEADIIDINMVLSPTVSDEAILDWLSPPSPTCIVDGEDVPCA